MRLSLLGVDINVAVWVRSGAPKARVLALAGGVVLLLTAAVGLLGAPGPIHARALQRDLPGSVQQSAATTITLTAPEALTVGGRSAVIGAAVVDGLGQPVADGTVVSFTVGMGQIAESGATVGGVATATLTSPVTAGETTLTAVSDAVSAEANVLFVADVPATLQLSSVPGWATAGTTAIVVATVRDAYGNAAGEGYSIAWSTTLGSVDHVLPVVRDGEARATLVSNRTGPAQVTASLPSGLMNTTTVTFRPGPAVSLEVTPASDRIPVGGQTDVDISARDSLGNIATEPLNVFLSSSGGVVRPAAVTLVAGRATARYSADDLPGEFQISAASDGRSGEGHVSVRPADLGIETIVRGPDGKVPEFQIHPGDAVRFEVTVRNADLASARNVVLGVVLPDAMINQQVDAPAGVYTRSTGPSGLIDSPPEAHHTRFWDLPDLDFDDAVTVVISGRIDESRTWTGLDNVYFRAATASTTVEASLGDLTRGRLVPVQAADMFVGTDIDHAMSILRPGGVAVLDIGFGNQFRTTEVGDVRITSKLPAGLIYNHWQPGLGASGISAAGEFDTASRELSWRVDPDHASTGSLRVWLDIDAETPPEAVLSHEVSIQSDVYEVDADNNVHVRGIALRGVNLDVSVDGAAEAAPGSEIRYAIALRNASQRDAATEVRLVVRPPAGGTNVRWTSGGIQGPDGSIAWHEPGLGAGGRMDFEVTLTLPERAVVGTFVVLAAESSSLEADSYPADNQASVQTRVVAGPPGLIELVARPTLEACAPEAVPVRARVADRYGNAVRDGTEVAWSLASGQVLDAGTTAAGVAEARLIAGRSAGPVGLEVTAGDAVAHADIDVGPARLGALALTVRPRIVGAGGLAEVTVNALDRCSQPVRDGQLVRLNAERGGWNGQRQVTLETQGGRVVANLQVGPDQGPLRIQARHDNVLGETIVSVVRPEEVPTATPSPGTRLYMPLVLGRRAR